MNNIQVKKPRKSKIGNETDTIKVKGSKAVKERMKKDKARFLVLFRENIAIITTTCQRANINRDTYYDWYRKDKLFAADIEVIRGEQMSAVEDRLMRKIINDDTTAIIFYLKSKHPEYKPTFNVNQLNNEEMDKLRQELNNLIKNVKSRVDKNT